jgi:hypothetical protein
LVEIMHMVLFRIGNPAWSQRYVKRVGALPNALRGVPDRPVAGGGFSAMPVSARVPHLRALSGRGRMGELLREVGGDALLQELPTHLAQICPEAVAEVRRDEAAVTTLYDLLRAYAGHTAACGRSVKAAAVHARRDEIALVPVRRADAALLTAVYIQIHEKTVGPPVPHETSGGLEERFVTLLATPHVWTFFLVVRECRVGWALLAANGLERLVLLPEWQDAYPQALAAVQAVADQRLRNYPFDTLGAAVSPGRVRCFADAGWQDTGGTVDGQACDGPSEGLAHTMTRVLGRPPARP